MEILVLQLCIFPVEILKSIINSDELKIVAKLREKWDIFFIDKQTKMKLRTFLAIMRSILTE